MMKRLTLLLGAGASRAVSYAEKREVRSPLDSDFFELLQKVAPKSHGSSDEKDETAIAQLIQWILANPDPIWTSMERTFYTLHLQARMSKVLFPRERIETTVERLLECFTRAVDTLLRSAHGTRSCRHHLKLVEKMRSSDAIITFNYDLVAERAIKKMQSAAEFGEWIYGFTTRPEAATDMIPTLYKLHGSVNWVLQDNGRPFEVRHKSWNDFNEQPGYRAHSGFAIMLP
jgi:hypothetical protein